VPVGRDDADALTEGPRPEDLVLDVVERDHVAGHRGGDHVGADQGRDAPRRGGRDRGGDRSGGGGLEGEVLLGLALGLEGLGLLLGGAVVGDDDEGHGDDERDRDGDDVHPHRLEDRDGQQRGERERAGLHAGERRPQDGDGQAAGEAAHQHARVDALVAEVDAVERRLGDAAEQARGERAGGRLAHGEVLVTHRQHEDARGGTEAGEVPCAHRALDEVVAERLDVDEHQGVERPVEAERHEERVQHRDQDGEDERRVRVEPREAGAQAAAEPDAERADEERGDGHHDRHREERHEHHLDVLWEDPLERLEDHREHRDHDERHEHLAAVAVELHGQPEDRRDTGLGAQRGVGAAEGVREPAGVGEADELRRHDGGHDRRAHPRVDVQLLRGVVGHHDGQEVEDRPPHGVDEHPGRRLVGGPEVDDAEGVQDRGERNDQRRAEQDAEQRTEAVGQVLEERVEPGDLAAGLGAGGGLDVGVRRAGPAGLRHRRQVHDVGVDPLHRAADDDLVAVTALRHGAHDAGDLLQGVLVDLAGVLEFETQARGAVRETDDVAGTADLVDDRRGRALLCGHRSSLSSGTWVH